MPRLRPQLNIGLSLYTYLLWGKNKVIYHLVKCGLSLKKPCQELKHCKVLIYYQKTKDNKSTLNPSKLECKFTSKENYSRYNCNSRNSGQPKSGIQPLSNSTTFNNTVPISHFIFNAINQSLDPQDRNKIDFHL